MSNFESPRDERAAEGKRWEGTLLLGVAALHVAFVLFLGSGAVTNAQTQELVGDRAPLLLMRPGFGSDQPSNLLLLTLFWSLFFGLALVTLGVLVRALERARVAVPRVIGVMLLAIGVAGAVWVPASGFWLVIPCGWSIARRGGAGHDAR